MEILYSTTILSFLKKIKKLAFEILSYEMRFKVGLSRLYYQGCSYSLQFVVFDHPSTLGVFQSNLFEIGINKVFLFEREETLKEIIRHELAHLATFLEFGSCVPAHGREFRAICKRYGWAVEVLKATVPIEKVVKNKRIVEKVRKLLSLAESPHPSEAKEATLKAQHLLNKYHVEYTPEEDETVLLRVLEKKRGSAKLQSIASIVKNFYVYPVFNKWKKGVYLEIIGDETTTKIAEYVAHFLDHQFEALWKEAQKEDPLLRGTASKNSFFRGLAEGYKDKEVDSKSLIRVENHLMTMAQKIYPHLSSVSSSFCHHERGARKGREKGKRMKIREGIQGKCKRFLLA